MQTAESLLGDLLFVLKDTKRNLASDNNISKVEALDILLHQFYGIIDGINGRFPHPIDLVVRKSTDADIADYKEHGEENKIVPRDIILNEHEYLHQIK